MTMQQLNRLVDIRSICKLGTDKFTEETVTIEMRWLYKQLIKRLSKSEQRVLRKKEGSR